MAETIIVPFAVARVAFVGGPGKRRRVQPTHLRPVPLAMVPGLEFLAIRIQPAQHVQDFCHQMTTVNVHGALSSNGDRIDHMWRVAIRSLFCLVCVTIVVLWITAFTKYEVRLTLGTYMFFAVNGNLEIYPDDRPTPTRLVVYTKPRVRGRPHILGSRRPLLVPGFSGRAGYLLPMWILAALAVGITAIVFRLTRRQNSDVWNADGCCPHCGYSRKGNVGDRCPECGVSLSKLDDRRALAEARSLSRRQYALLLIRFYCIMLFFGYVPATLTLYVSYLVSPDAAFECDAVIGTGVYVCWFAVAGYVFVRSMRTLRKSPQSPTVNQG